ncbi:MAG: hypothetical protein KDK70_19555 [Myxococcales bacterium]|nr:hypothetical protein [Myxococcales bacterium]
MTTGASVLARWRGFGRAAAMAGAMALSLPPLGHAHAHQNPGGEPGSAPGATPELEAPDPRVEPKSAPSAAPELDPAASDPEARQGRRRWAACAPNIEPCTRPRPARALLLGLGVLAGATAAGLLFGLGDRLVQADPATLLVGLGAVAGAGALVGAVAGRLGADGPAVPDRLRPSTAGLTYGYAGPAVLDEARPHSMALRFAPNLQLPYGHGRLRLFGHVGGWLAPTREVDPRPQSAAMIDGQEGTAPVVLRQRHLSLGVGFDLAVALPYPVLSPRRSAHLGPAELRYRPQVQVRRDRFAPGTPSATVLERTILLPLTVGARWVLSPRQRFTLYAGPRFDYVAFSDPGASGLRRGGAQVGPLYGEAWYDVDVPLRARHHRPARVLATGQLTLGYIHGRFDGQGFNFGPVIGFLGPIHVGWSTRLRPVGAPVAVQLGAFGRLGTGTRVGLELGLVAPDLHARARSRR